MTSVTIRNLDDAVVEKLKARAKQHNRSLAVEVREILTEAVRGTPKRRLSGAELRARAERIAAMTPDVPQTDSVEILRKFRDR